MKLKLFLALFLAVTVFLGAQTIHDPNNELYKDIDIWLVQGYVTEFLPMIRPYPAPLIIKILDQVIENGDTAAQERAERYKTFLEPKSRFIHPGVKILGEGNDEEKSVNASAFLEGVFIINPALSLSYNLSFFALTDGKDGEVFNVPGTYSPYPDLEDDQADIGPFRILQNWTNIIAVGTSNVYFQAGLSRSSFGPFYDNGIVIGPQAPRAGHFSFVFWDPVWSYEMLFQTLVATDDYGKGQFTSKYNIIHMLNLRLLDNFEFGFTQTLVYGERIDLLYFVPFSYLFGAQSINGFLDNAFMGLNFRWKIINSLQLKGQVYIDDFSFNGLLDGNPYFKAAGQLGASWAPRSSALFKLDFDYTAVMPYMYTHWTEPWYNRYNGISSPSDPQKRPGNFDDKNRPRVGNYLNYTHMGRNLGPDLEPNSDRFSVRSTWRILKNIELNVSAYLTRHGNASKDKEYLEEELHDGSIFDAGTTDPWLTDGQDGRENIDEDRQYYKEVKFLTQSYLETLLGGTFGVTWTIPTSFGTFKLLGDYGIQYGWNRGLINDNNGFDHFWSIGGMWSW